MLKMVRTALTAAFATASLSLVAGDTVEAAARAHDCTIVDAPQIFSSGGPVIASPRIVPIVFAADPLSPDLLDFVGKYASGPLFAASLDEYGVHGAEVAPPVVLTDPPPAHTSSDEIADWLSTKFLDPTFPQPDARSVYVVTYPEGTAVDIDFSFDPFPACSLTGAFHRNVTSPSGAAVPFVVAPHCPGFLGLSGLDEVTMTLSSELVGAITDPQFDGYASPDFNGSVIGAVSNAGEIAEFCEFNTSTPGFVKPPSLGYTIARVWSNRAARSGREPCLPSLPGQHYFNTFPVGIDGIELSPFVDTKGIPLAPGAQITIPIRLFSDGDGPHKWQLSALEAWDPFFERDPFHQLSFSFDKTTGHDGDVRYLTVTRAPASPGTDGAELTFAIQSTSGDETHTWLVGVGR